MRAASGHEGMRAGEGGYVLVSLLWVLGVLAIVMTTMGVFTVNSLSVVASSNDRAAVEALARGGVEAAILDITETRQGRALRGQTRVDTPAGSATTDWRGETGRVDLNQAPPEVIQNLVAGIAGDDSETAETVTRIILRRRPGPPGSPPPTAGPFRHLGELTLDGAPDDFVAKLAPYVTVYGGSAKIDPRLAPREVLSYLPDMSEARLRGLLALRASGSEDKTAWTREAGSAANLLTLEPSRTIRLRVNARLDKGATGAVEAVIIVFPDDEEPYRVLAWNDHPGKAPLDDIGEDLP